MSTRGMRRCSALLAAIVAGAFACGDTPTTPDSVKTWPGTSGIFPQSMSIGGRTSLAEPGETSQLTATVTFSDGSTKEVNADTTWNATPKDIVSIAPGGLLTARAYGAATVTAWYGPGTSAQVKVRVMPEGAFMVYGHVTEAGVAGLENVRVEASSAARTVTATTDARGFYSLVPVDAGATIRAEREGFEPQVKRPAASGEQQRLDFELQRIDALATVDGLYELTITASSSCTTLPAEAVRWIRTAQVTEKQGMLFVALKEEEPAVYGIPGFTGRRTGTSATFTITDDIFADYAMVALIGTETYLSYTGKATGDIAARRITATFDGAIVVTRSLASPIGHCRAADHRLEFVR